MDNAAGAGVSIDELLQRGYRFAYALTHDAWRADDLFQDAWLAVLKARGPWTTPYLFAAIRNRFIDHCRRDVLASFEPLADEAEFARDPDATACGAADSGLAQAWENVQLAPALARLRPEERAILFLSATEGLSAQQIADLLDWPRSTVLSMNSRACAKLRRWMGVEPGAAT